MKTADELKLRVQQIRGLFAQGDAKGLPKATMALCEFVEKVAVPALDNPCGPACDLLPRRQRAFVHALVSGGPNGEPLPGATAYMAAAYKVKNPDIAASCASRLQSNAKVKAAIEEHQARRAAETADARTEAVAILETMYRLDSPVKDQTKVQAIQQRSRMEPGWLAPQRHEVNTGDMLALVVLELAESHGVPEAQALVARWSPALSVVEQQQILGDAARWLVATVTGHTPHGGA